MMASLAVPQMSSSRMGGTSRKTMRPWCARLTADQKGGVKREYIEAAIEWHARRVTHYFVLPEGAYEVFEPTNPREGDRYFAISRDGTVHRAEFEEVLQCLSEC